MLHFAKNTPVGLGQYAQLPPVCINWRHALTQNHYRKRCMARAAEHRLESLVAATAVAFLVEASSPVNLSYLDFAPKAALSAEGAAALLEVKADVPHAGREKGLKLMELMVAPQPATKKSDNIGGGDGFLGSSISRKQKADDVTASTAAAEQLPAQLSMSAAEGATPSAGAAGVVRQGEAAAPPASTAISKAEDEGPVSVGGSGSSYLFITEALEKAALLTAGGLAGVALVRTFAAPANRAVDTAATAALLDARPASPGTSAAAYAAAANTAVDTAPSDQDESSPQAAAARMPYSGYEETEYPYGGPTPSHTGSASGGRRRPAARRPPSPPAGAVTAAGGRWQLPGPAPAQGGRPSPAAPSPAAPPPYIDADAADYEAFPPPGSFYGPPPPPWWREQYADYDRYDVPYTSRPSYHGQADADDGEPAAAPKAPYYYYYGAPEGYWGWDAVRRWGPPPPYDASYAGYDPAAAPGPFPPSAVQARGFAGMRDSPGTMLGRNPWAVMERVGPEQEPGPAAATVGVRAVPSPSPAGSRGGASASRAANAAADPAVPAASAAAQDLAARPAARDACGGNLAQVDSALAQLQAQIDELQGSGVAVAAASAAPSIAAPCDQQHAAESRQRHRVDDMRGWRQLLQEEEQQQQQHQEPQQQLEGTEGRGAAVMAAAAAACGEQQQRNTPAVSVSPSADREYAQLLQMWLEAHPDEVAVDGDRVLGGGVSMTSDGVVAEAADGSRNNQGPVVEILEKQQQLGGQGTQVEISGGEGGMDVAAAQPPFDATSVSAQEPSGSGSGGGGGHIEWFARVFRGWTGGGGTSTSENGRAAATQQQREEQQQQPAAEQVVQDVQQAPGQRVQQEQGGQLQQPTLERSREACVAADSQEAAPQEAKPVGAQHPLQQQKQQEDSREVQHRRGEEVSLDAEQAQAGAALAAAVQAALHGQLAEQEQQQPGQVGEAAAAATMPPAAAAAGANAATAAPVASSQLQPTAGASMPAAVISVPLRRPPSPPSPPPSPSLPNKETIQHLKATSAAAADRAAETLARIRAMRAAVQAAGTRSGSGGRSYSSANGNGNGLGSISNARPASGNDGKSGSGQQEAGEGGKAGDVPGTSARKALEVQ